MHNIVFSYNARCKCEQNTPKVPYDIAFLACYEELSVPP